MAEPTTRRARALALAALLGAAGCAGLRAGPDQTRRAADEGRDADRAMAAAVAVGDLPAFAAHVATDGIFFTGRGPAPGRGAVADAWAPLFAADGPRLAWAPDLAIASPAGDLVFTLGSATFTPAGGGAPQHGRYLTAWRRDGDGLLRVALDGADDPLPPLPEGAVRRALRTYASGDGALLAEGGLLLEGEREAGWYLWLSRRSAAGLATVAEGGHFSPAAR